MPKAQLLIAASALLLFPASAASADDGQLTCSWRAPAEDGSADDPTGDPGAPWTPGTRLRDATWRSLDEHFQQHHFGLWTAEEVAALEATPGVALGVLHPLPDALDEVGRLVRSEEVGAIQWPARIRPSDMVLVAIGNAQPGEDWVLYPRQSVDGDTAPPLDGPSTTSVDPAATGFYRVHRVVHTDPYSWESTSWRAQRVELNLIQLETSLELTTDVVQLNIPRTRATSPQVLASGRYTVSTRSTEPLEGPAVVNIALRGPAANLFTLELLPAGGEPVASSDRSARVVDHLDFLVLAPPTTLSGSAFINGVMPDGEALMLEITAEIVSFANDDGDDLDLGLTSQGFSATTGDPVVFPPSSVLPRRIVQRSVFLEVWRPAALPASE